MSKDYKYGDHCTCVPLETTCSFVAVDDGTCSPFNHRSLGQLLGREEPPYAVRGGSLVASEVKKDPSGISDSRKSGCIGGRNAQKGSD